MSEGACASALALPRCLLRYVSPQQLEFLACGEDVDVRVVRPDARARLLRVLGVRAVPLAQQQQQGVLRMRLHTCVALQAQFGRDMRVVLPAFVSHRALADLIAAEQAPQPHEGEADEQSQQSQQQSGCVLGELPMHRFYFYCYVLVQHALTPAAAVAEGLDVGRFLAQLNELFNARMEKLERALRRAHTQGFGVLACRNLADMELFAVRRHFTLATEQPALLASTRDLCASTLDALGSQAPESASLSSLPASSSSYTSSAPRAAAAAAPYNSGMLRPRSAF